MFIILLARLNKATESSYKAWAKDRSDTF